MPRRNHCRLLKPQRVSQNFVENFPSTDDSDEFAEVLLPLLAVLLLEWHPGQASCTELATAVTRWLVDVRKPIVQARDAS